MSRENKKSIENASRKAAMVSTQTDKVKPVRTGQAGRGEKNKQMYVEGKTNKNLKNNNTIKQTKLYN